MSEKVKSCTSVSVIKKGIMPKSKKEVRSRICEIVIPLVNLQTGEKLNVDSVEKETLRILQSKHHFIKNYCYIIHDNDMDNKGNKIDHHIHMAIEWANPKNRSNINEWFKSVNGLVVKHQYLMKCKTNYYYADLCFQLIYDSKDKTKLRYPFELLNASFDPKPRIVEYLLKYYNSKGDYIQTVSKDYVDLVKKNLSKF